MQETLMVGLTERDMAAVVNTYDLKPYYYPTLFPLKERVTLDWKMLEAQAGLKIAADIVARGSSAPRKTRDAIARIQGDIPKILVERFKDENELNEYDIMIAMSSGNADLKAIVDFWAEDTKFVYEAVASRLEWTALQTISLGKVKLTNDNNNSVVSEFDVDYDIDADRKIGFQSESASWATSASAKPISKDFKSVITSATSKGISPKFAFMNLDTFSKFAETEEVIKMCASFANNALGISQTPSLEVINSTLRGTAYLKGLQIALIDQDITIEKSDGSRTTGNPFANDVVTFTESKVLGNTFWKKPADLKLQGSKAIKALNGHTLVKKFSEENPIVEFTQGLANAFPAWNGSTRSFLMDTANNTWSK